MSVYYILLDTNATAEIDWKSRKRSGEKSGAAAPYI